MIRRLLFAVDESADSKRALRWGLHHLLTSPEDEVHLVTVMPPVVVNVYPVAPVATAGSVVAVSHQWDIQRHTNELHAAAILKEALHICCAEYKVVREQVHTRALAAVGGASGIADSLVEYAHAMTPVAAVLGSRGMGAFKRSLMSLLGLGSVSDYCLHHMPCPVMVVPPQEQLVQGKTQAQPDTTGPSTSPPQPPFQVCVAADCSPQSLAALHWALDQLGRPATCLHLISVVMPVPFPVFDEPGIAMMEAQQHASEVQRAQDEAKACVAQATQVAAQHGVTGAQLVTAVLNPEGGASDIGASVCHYAKNVGADVVVVGSRGMGAWQRSLAGLLGLGSVSDYCAHHLHCVLAVIRQLPPHAAAPAGPATAQPEASTDQQQPTGQSRT